MLYLGSNIPSKISYTFIGSEILCMAVTKTDLSNRVKVLVFCLYGGKTKVVNVIVYYIFEKDSWETI